MSASEATPTPQDDNVYTRHFWLAFSANVALVSANALTFRFAEFVKFLGGSEEQTGIIVSIGLVGSLVLRLFLGQAIDRFGVRRVWLQSAVVYLTGCLLLVATQSLGWQVYVARIIFALGLASMFACSVSHIQTMAPPHRRTEVIGTFGASGFLGMIVGAQLGDLLFQTYPESRGLYAALFGLTAVLGLLHAALAAAVTNGHEHSEPHETPAIHRLLWRHFPGPVLLVALMMGLVLAVTTVFLTRYTTELQLSGLRTFFTAYAITAFTVRIISRHWSRSMGRHRMIVLGLLTHAVGQLLLLLVTNDWLLIPPAMCSGFGHALLFPCVVSLGAGAFPRIHRGTGTTITLAFVDLGLMVTAPFLGWLIDNWGFAPMFSTAAGILFAMAALYGLMTAHIVDADLDADAVAEADRRRTSSVSISPADSFEPSQPSTSQAAKVVATSNR